MPEVIEIDGGLVRRINREVVSEHRLEDVLPHLERRMPVRTPILPRNPVRLLRWDESNPQEKTLDLVISLDPAVRTLPMEERDKPRDGDGNPIDFRVALPYTVFAFHLRVRGETPRGRDWEMRDIKVFFSRDRITSENQRLITAQLPNVYEDGRICWGNTAVNANQPVADRIDELVNGWYLSEFSDHHVRERQFPWNGRTYRRWVRETQQKGGAAYLDFPEWDPGDQHATYRPTIAEVFGWPERTTEVVMRDGIPPLNFTPTFGRAAEWLAGLTATQRFRLRAALETIERETPDQFEQPTVLAEEDDD